MRIRLGEPSMTDFHEMPIPKGGTPPAGNKLYFFKDVSDESISDLCGQLEEAARSLRTTFCVYPDVTPPPIHLYINSGGGELFAGLAAYHYLRQLQYPVHAHVIGGAMSAASIILLGCDIRTIGKHAAILIHQLSTGFWGKHDEMKDEMKNMDLLMAQLQAIYLERTRLSRKMVNALLKRDLYLSAEQALQHGFVSRVER